MRPSSRMYPQARRLAQHFHPTHEFPQAYHHRTTWRRCVDRTIRSDRGIRNVSLSDAGRNSSYISDLLATDLAHCLVVFIILLTIFGRSRGEPHFARLSINIAQHPACGDHVYLARANTKPDSSRCSEALHRQQHKSKSLVCRYVEEAGGLYVAATCCLQTLHRARERLP